MFNRLFRKTPAIRPSDTAMVPDGQRIYAIGDIHGRHDLLTRLLDQIENDNAKRGPANMQIIFLGDLVDRGPDSAAVIETAIALQSRRPETRFLMGNHEEVFLQACAGADPKLIRFFLKIGGEATILSYPVDRNEYAKWNMSQLAERLPALIPQKHIDFLSSFENYIIIGDYAFVHAGIKPGVPLPEQQEQDLRWIRNEFLSHKRPFEKVIVHGHSIVEEVEETGTRIGIDTGAFASDKLTAIGLQGEECWYLQS